MRNKAACSVVRRPDTGDILAVSRGHDTSDWGLPGGEVEPGEAFQAGAARELREETGCVVGYHARLIHVGSSHTEMFETRFFMVDGGIFIPERLGSEPFEGFAEWKRPEEMISHQCSFGKIQLELFKHLGIL